MKWYYAEGGKQIGPVEESVLDDLVRQGVVRDDTLVWREGMAAWQRHAAARGPNPDLACRRLPRLPPAPAACLSVRSDTRYCSECGRAFPASQLTSYGDVAVCTQCQPAYSQRFERDAPFWRFLDTLPGNHYRWHHRRGGRRHYSHPAGLGGRGIGA